jgi:ABC-2 type transport system permease protein
MSCVLHIAGVELRRFLRDRSNLFFVFIFPLMLVLLIGAQFGDRSVGGRAVVVGADSALRTDLVVALEAQELDVGTSDREDALEQVARGRADVAVLTDPAASTAYAEGDAVELSVVPSSQAGAQTALQQVQVAVARLSTVHGQVAALTSRGVDAGDAEEALDVARGRIAVPRLEVQSVDELDREFAGLGRFDFGASGQLLLFVFLASLTGSATLIQARKLGVVTRILAAPVSMGQVVVGEALGRFAIAVFQGGYIMAATALLFGVSWGSWWLSLVILGLFGLVAAGAAMVIGATLDNEGAASGIGVGVGLVMAALGGAMMPLELFPDTMRLVAHATPHAWAYEAFAEIQRRDGGVLDILPQLGVLAGMAAVVLAVGTWALRRSLGRPI